MDGNEGSLFMITSFHLTIEGCESVTTGDVLLGRAARITLVDYWFFSC
jgi:hypothetical protein